MKPFTTCTGHAAVMMQDNIDTDMIIRIERIARLKRGEFAPWAFEASRYLPDGSENPGFVLNRAPFRDAKILVSGANFGCGSSREMAVWSLEEFGIRCIVAKSYGDIFFNNCLQNGLLPIVLEPVELNRLADAGASGAVVSVDLRACSIEAAGLARISFTLPGAQRNALLAGADDIDLTLQLAAEIDRFQARDRHARPWAYP